MPEITFQDIRRAVIDRKATRARIQRSWDFYRGDVDRPPYFPYLHNELPDHYRDRLKIAVGWCGTLADRVAAYFRKEPITAHFLVDGKEEGELAEKAAGCWGEIAAYNAYAPFMVDVARDAGVGGNGYTKERFVYFDAETGDEFRTGDMRGRVLIDRVNEVFVYRIPIAGAIALVEAWALVDGSVQILEEGLAGQEVIEYIELLKPARYDVTTGKPISPSAWAIWKTNAPTYGPEKIAFRVPMQRFANMVSRPESENGVSDIKAAIPLNSMINHVFSGAARAVQYHGEPKMKASGVEDVADLKWGTDNIVFLPTATDGNPAQLDFLTWDQNLSGAQALYRDAADIMTAIAGVPKHMMHDLEGAGHVPSGVALRILYEAMNQVCVMKEAGFKRAEETMIKGCLEQIAYYNGAAGKFKDVQVEVKYNPNRTPVDLDAEFKADTQRLLQNYLNLVDLVIKYEPSVETREQAMEYLRIRADEKKQLREMGLVANAFQWEDFGDDRAGDREIPPRD